MEEGVGLSWEVCLHKTHWAALCGKVSRMGGTDPDYTTLFLLKSLRPPPSSLDARRPKYSRPSRTSSRLSGGPKADFLVKTQFGRDLHIAI